jgi:hypothetical protein
MALLRYTLLRAGVFVAVAALLWLIGIREIFWLLLIALFASGIISIFVLRKSRDDVSSALVNRTTAIKAKLSDRSNAEDAWDDARRRAADHDSSDSEPGKEA